jgi:hypothetical protein
MLNGIEIPERPETSLQAIEELDLRQGRKKRHTFRNSVPPFNDSNHLFFIAFPVPILNTDASSFFCTMIMKKTHV